MTKSALPPQGDLLEYILAQGGYVARRDIARAFRIKGVERRLLKDFLKSLVEQGVLETQGKSYRARELKEFVVVEVLDPNNEGDLLGCVIEEGHPHFEETVILRPPAVQRISFLKKGDKWLVKLVFIERHLEGSLVRRIEAQPRSMVGILKQEAIQWYLAPLDKKERSLYLMDPLSVKEKAAQSGDLVEVSLEKDPSHPHKIGRVQEILARQDHIAKHLSMIPIHQFDLPYIFNPDILKEAESLSFDQILKERRVDIRDIPLVTIDDKDARDHDDAVYAEPDEDKTNLGGWRILVAIADVSAFVPVGSALDKEAKIRGNSVYFPDQVIPMLPERLSNDLCSLRPLEDRPCLAVWIRVTKQGKLVSKKFFRGLMRSYAKLTYIDVQEHYNRKKTQFSKTLPPGLIDNLYGAYQVLKQGREKRGTLDLDIPEQKIMLTPEGLIREILPRHRFESHKLIEEFMILANVAAAEFISDRGTPCLFRVHDSPKPEKVEELRLFLKANHLNLAKQGLQPRNFTHILDQVRDTPLGPAIHQLVLRSQAQANYSPENIGHFGLNLARYTHFTSPIRRYADLTIHRALISLIARDKGLYPYSYEELKKIGEEISERERRAVKAERETVDRYVAIYLQERTGDLLPARVSGMTEFAIFVTLDETGSDGLLPLRNLGGDYFQFDPKAHLLKGRRTKKTLALGDPISVRLESADPLTGSLLFSATLFSNNEEKKSLKKSWSKKHQKPLNKRKPSKNDVLY